MAKEKKLTEDDYALLLELGVEIEVKRAVTYTVREERIIAGFKEIQKFVLEQGRLPERGDSKDIFERLYAVRLDQIRKQEESRKLLKELDYQNILNANDEIVAEIAENINDDELLTQLGIDENAVNSITVLKHIVPRAEKRAIEEIANRTRCEDFIHFKPLFEAVKKDIDRGNKNTVHFRKDAGFTKTTLKVNQFIIVGGQMAYIAEMGEIVKAPNGEDDARLRVIYANGTESNILLRSLIRAMYKDETSRFISNSNLGPLFSGEMSDDDQESGTIYVLRSLSDHPIVAENRSLIHKIGVTGGSVKKRVANAKNDPTFLMADVEIIATYELSNIIRVRLESIIHKFFHAANLNIEVKDRFGKLIKVREWFLVPIFIITEMIDRIKDETISDYYYDPTLVEIKKY